MKDKGVVNLCKTVVHNRKCYAASAAQKSRPQITNAGAKERGQIKNKVLHCFVCPDTQDTGAIRCLTSLDHGMGSSRIQYLTTWSRWMCQMNTGTGNERDGTAFSL